MAVRFMLAEKNFNPPVYFVAEFKNNIRVLNNPLAQRTVIRFELRIWAINPTQKAVKGLNSLLIIVRIEILKHCCY